MKFKNIYHNSYNEIWVSNDQIYKLTFLHDIIVTTRYEHWWIVKYTYIAMVWFWVIRVWEKEKDENIMRKKQVSITIVLANCNLTKIKIYRWAHINMPEKMSRSNIKTNKTKYYN